MTSAPKDGSSISDEEGLFEVWWALYRTKRWREIRPDMGPEPSDGYLLGLKDTAKLGWLARAGTHVGGTFGLLWEAYTSQKQDLERLRDEVQIIMTDYGDEYGNAGLKHRLQCALAGEAVP